MASVVACTRCFPDAQASFMEVHEPRPPSHHRLFAKRSERLMPPGRCVCHRVRGRVLNFTLHVGDYNSLVKSPAMSAGKGNLATNFKGLCKVIWTIVADLDDGQHLYITGDPSALGSWKPDMATLMSPTEHCNLWKAEVKIARGINFKYSYFIRGAQPSRDIIWRQGPTYSLSVPLFGEMNNKITVRDSWTRFEIETHQHFPPLWGSWMDDTCYSVKLSASDSTQDEGEILESLTGALLEAKRLFNDLPANNDCNHVIEDSIHAIRQAADSGGTLTEEYQPVEEPWLLQSSVSFAVPRYKMNSVFSKCKEHPPDDLTQPRLHNQHLQDVEKLLPEKVDLQISLDGPSSTVILVNSSICTMQRIAVLEDEKLVELLLEPVKNNVQCDSVYLGVITKLVPHMGGAFVNIGSSRPSLMGINHNREPFVFPLFHHIAKNKELDGSVHGMHRDHTVVHENEPISHENIEVSDALAEVGFQDDPLQFVNHDLEEQEIKNDLYVPEVVEENLNGSIINFGEVDDDFEDYIDITEQQIEGETVSDLHSVGTADINDSHLLNDPRNSSTGNKWGPLQKGTKIIVQVVKEGLGTKGPALTAYPKLRSRFWILITRCNKIGISKKISGAERTRLKVIAKTLQPEGFGLTVRTVAVGHSVEELKNDLESLLSIWKNITAHAKSATLAAEEGVEGAIPVLLHRAMGQTVSVVQDYFNEKVKRMVVDSPRTYHEVTNYLQEIDPDLCKRVELYNKRIPLFDEFNIEDEINNILNKRVPLVNGGSLVIEQTEALVSIDVNGGHGMLGQGTSQEKAVLDVNIAAAKQIARELRLRDIGGIIVVDFIDMTDDSNKRMVYEEVKKTVMRDRSKVKVSELSKHGLMEITRKRVRPSVTFMISEPCTCCHATGRVEALETSFSKIEREICRLIAMTGKKSDPENPKSWPRLVLKVDQYMSNYLTSGKKTRLATLSSSLKVWILIKVARGFNRGAFEVKALTDDKVNDYRNRVPIPLLQSVGVGTHNRTRKVTIFPVKKSKAPQK